MTDQYEPAAVTSKDKDFWESNWDEWWTTDRLDAVGWAGIFFWAAVVVIANATDIRDSYDWWEPWGVFWVGAGIVVLFEAIARALTVDYRSKLGWTLFWGSAFLALGLGELANPGWYALPLATIGLLFLTGAFQSR